MKKLYAILILSIISFGNALYLSIEAFRLKSGATEEFLCDINEKLSCSSLFTFDFAWLFGTIPFPLIALFVYPIIAILTILGIKKVIKFPFLPLFIIAVCGMAFNSYFIYNEYLVGVYCPACLACSVAITTIAILSLIGMLSKKELA